MFNFCIKERKNAKLVEIERVLHDDIMPAIEKLKQERSAFLDYQTCQREYEHMKKISVAYKFLAFQSTLVKASEERNSFIALKRNF